MAREVNQAGLPEYTGAFSQNPELLSGHIKEANADYFPWNPKTWPVVTSAYLTNYLGYEYDGSWLLPSYIAYERKLIDKCVANFANDMIIVNTPEGKAIERLTYYQLFPFVFNHLGVARREEYMTADHYSRYVHELTGVLPITDGQSSYALSITQAATDVIDMTTDITERHEEEDAKLMFQHTQGELRRQKALLSQAKSELVEQKKKSEIAITKLKNELAQTKDRAVRVEKECSMRLEEVKRLNKAQERANKRIAQLQSANPVPRSDRVEKQQQRKDISTLARKMAFAEQEIARIQGEMNRSMSVRPSTAGGGILNAAPANAGFFNAGTPNLSTPDLGPLSLGTPDLGTPSRGFAFRGHPNAGSAQVRIKREEY